MDGSSSARVRIARMECLPGWEEGNDCPLAKVGEAGWEGGCLPCMAASPSLRTFPPLLGLLY